MWSERTDVMQGKWQLDNVFDVDSGSGHNTGKCRLTRKKGCLQERERERERDVHRIYNSAESDLINVSDDLNSSRGCRLSSVKQSTCARC